MSNYWLEVGLIFFVAFVGIFQMVEGAFFHELGHLNEARKYKYAKAEIKLKIAFPLCKVKDCKMTKDIHLKYGGGCILDNGYLVYTDDELKAIARAGLRGAYNFVFTTGIISLVLTYLFGYIIHMDDVLLCFLLSASFILTIMNVILNLIKYNKKSEWGDKEIYLDPAGFRNYAKGTEDA